MKKFKIYLETSVFGGCFDDEFSYESKKLFDDIRNGKFILVLSSTTIAEINKAPSHVQEVLTNLPPETVEIIEYRIINGVRVFIRGTALIDQRI